MPGKQHDIRFSDSENRCFKLLIITFPWLFLLSSHIINFHRISCYALKAEEDADLFTFCKNINNKDPTKKPYAYHETASGGLLEILIPKMGEIDNVIVAPRGNIVTSIAGRSIKLGQDQEEESRVNQKENQQG